MLPAFNRILSAVPHATVSLAAAFREPHRYTSLPSSPSPPTPTLALHPSCRHCAGYHGPSLGRLETAVAGAE